MGLVTLLAQTTEQGCFSVPVALSMLSLVVAVCAFSVAARNFYLSRFQHVRCGFDTHMISDAEFPNGEVIFNVEVESWGLPVWDIKVALEVHYAGQYGAQFGRYTLALEPVGSVANPLNAGQIAKFRITRTRVRNLLHNPNRRRGISDIPAEKVYVCIYGSAERRIRYYNRAEFGKNFWWFDSVDSAAADRQAKRFSNWSKRALHRSRQRIFRQRPMTQDEYSESRFRVMSEEVDRERRAASADNASVADIAKQTLASIRATGLTDGTRHAVRGAIGKVYRRAVDQTKLKLSRVRHAREAKTEVSK